MTQRTTRYLLTAAMAALFTGPASAVIVNADLEDGDSPGSGGISSALPPDFEIVRTWGPNGEDFLHTSASRAGNETLGSQFAFYSNNGGEAVYQILDDTVAESTAYELSLWMNEGGTPQLDEVAGLFIGAVDIAVMDIGPGLAEFGSTLADFQAAGVTILANAEISPQFEWTQESFAMNGAAPSGVVGQQLVIGFYNSQSGYLGEEGLDPTPNDIWFDEFSLSSTPVVGGLPGDTNGDGDVDNSDLQTAIANFTGPQTDPPTFTKTVAEGDNNADGAVSNVDLQAAISNFTGPNPAPVPEPTSLALLGLGGLLIARRRRA